MRDAAGVSVGGHVSLFPYVYIREYCQSILYSVWKAIYFKLYFLAKQYKVSRAAVMRQGRDAY